ncbi:hypothetical protein ACHAPV_004591 [Trichoderma viride]
MTEAEQNEGRPLIQSEASVIDHSMVEKPSNHRVYKQCKAQPAWAKYILSSSIYRDTPYLSVQLKDALGGSYSKDYTSEHQRNSTPIYVEQHKRLLMRRDLHLASLDLVDGPVVGQDFITIINSMNRSLLYHYMEED